MPRHTEGSNRGVYNSLVAIPCLPGEVEARIRSYCDTSVAGKHVEIRLRRDEEHSAPNQFHYRVHCISCQKCHSDRGRRGRATYVGNTQTLQIRGLSLSEHGTFDRRYGGRETALHAQEVAFIREWLKSNRYRVMPLVVALQKQFGEQAPREGRVRTYVKT